MFIALTTSNRFIPSWMAKTQKSFINLNNILRIEVIENKLEFYTITRPTHIAYSVYFDTAEEANTFANGINPKTIMSGSICKEFQNGWKANRGQGSRDQGSRDQGSRDQGSRDQCQDKTKMAREMSQPVPDEMAMNLLEMK
jgi:hypothetical protein